MKAAYFFLVGLLSIMWMQSASQIQNTLDFDGVDDFVTVADNPSLDGFTVFTIEAWVKLNSMDANKGIVAKRQGSAQTAYVLMIRGTTNRRVYFRINAEQNTFHANYTLTIGRWHHIAAVFNGNAAQTERKKIYIDGILRATGGSNETSVINSITNLTIGWINGNLTSYLNGSIDEVRIWNTERTQLQIRNNMHRKLDNPAGMTSLVAYYDFDQSGGNMVPDESANSNDGILANMDPSNDWITSTAPIPYYTVQDGNWEDNNTWAAGQYAPTRAWARAVIDNQVSLITSANARDITINTGKTLMINPNASLTVNGTLANNAGNAGITVKADATGMGSLLHSTPGINGTVEQYLTADSWHYVSSPVASAVSMVYYNLYLMNWSEPGNNWTFISATNVPLNVTQGYSAWASSSLTGTTTVSFTGALNTGDKMASLTYTPGQGNGWNFIGNPFPSSVDWNTNWVTTNVDPTVYAWSGSQYLTWNRSTLIGTKTDGTIPVSQGFFVKANAAAPTLVIPQSERIHGSQAFYKTDAAMSYLKLLADGNGYEDKAIISYHKMATPGFDNEFDAWKLWGISEAPQLYSITPDNELTVNTLPENTEMVNLGYSVGFAGTYSIVIDEIKGEFSYLDIYLEDKKEDIMMNLSASGKYVFTAHPADDPDRFILHFTDMSDLGLPEANNVKQAKIYSYHDRVYVQVNGSEKLTATVYTLTGQEVLTVQLENNNLNSFPVISKSGTYIVKIKGDGITESRKIYIRND